MSAPVLAAPSPQLPALPGPRGLWGVVRTTWWYLRDTLGMHTMLAERYGDALIMDTLFGPVLHTSNPELVRQVFTGDADAFESFSDTFVPLFGPESVFLLVGERHQFERKLLAPSFQASRVKGYSERMLATARERMATWKPGGTYTMQEEMAAITLEIIITTVFGVLEPERVKTYIAASRAIMRSIWEPSLFFKPLRLRLFGYGPWARFERAIKNLDALLLEDMVKRREGNIRGEDVLSELLFARYDDGSEMPYSAVRDEMVSMLMAGHDTSASVLCGALYEIHRNPEVLARLREELDSVPADAPADAVASLKYLDACCKEALRIRTPTSDTPRRLKHPMTVGGHTLPAGTGILIAVWAIHNRADLYPDPQAFRPERFLERSYAPHELVTFGGGGRRCIGAAFALTSMKLTVAAAVRDWDLRLVDDGPVPLARRGMPFCQADGVPMVATARREVAAVENFTAPSGGSGCPFHHA